MILFDNLKLNRVILELKFEDGFLYLDKCGSILKKIHADFSGWERVRITPDGGAVLKNKKDRLELLYSMSFIRFVQTEVENLNKFRTITSDIIPVIISELDIGRFSRIGNRYLYLFPLKNIEQGEELIKKSDFFTVREEKIGFFGERLKNSRFVFVIESDYLNYRLDIYTIERDDAKLPENIKINETYTPKYALQFDIDVFTEKPTNVVDFDSSIFIQKVKKTLENNLIPFFFK